MKSLPLLFFTSAIFFCLIDPADAAQARISRITKEVKLLQGQSAPRAAILNETIGNGTAIETAAGAQAELRFDNGALVRLGQNSVFNLKDGSRRMELVRGAVLVRAAKGSGDVRIATGNVASSVRGTTSLLEHYPGAYTKLISLEGTARMFMPGVIGESVLVNAGQLLMFHTKPAATSLPNPVDIDLNRLAATSLLIKDFAPLGSESSIARGMQNQKKQKSEGALADTNLVIFGRGTLVSLVPPEAENAKSTPSPTPGQNSSSSRRPR
jgi:hypothetical protein